VVTAAGNQILAFSLASGLEKGHFFGTAPVIVASAGLLAVEKDAKELDLFRSGVAAVAAPVCLF
jgi:hypothetical protein